MRPENSLVYLHLFEKVRIIKDNRSILERLDDVSGNGDGTLVGENQGSFGSIVNKPSPQYLGYKKLIKNCHFARALLARPFGIKGVEYV